MPFAHNLYSRKIFYATGLALLLSLGISTGVCLSAVPVRAELVDCIKAVVNNEVILLSDLNSAMQPWRQKLKQEGYSEAQQSILLADQHPKMLEQLINEKLTDQQIKLYKINVGDTEVDATIERIMEANRLTRDKLSRMLEMDGLTYEDYRSQIKEQLLRTKLVNVEVKSKIVITEKEVRKYYEDHSEQYGGSTQFHLRHILIRLSPEASIEQKQRARDRLSGVYDRLQEGERFEQLAKTYSEASTAEMGGDLGEYEERLLAAPIRQALKGLQPGQYTQIIDTEQGLQIFMLEDISQKGGKPFKEVKSEIQEKLYTEIVDQKFQAWLEGLRRNSHIKILE